jgi:dinuclear metal center YbgI/SA1388 family protein
MSETTVADALLHLDAIAPPRFALGEDPRGLLIGDPAASVRGGIVVALDVTARVVVQARECDAGLIVAHHPLIYHPLRRLRADDGYPGAVALDCARSGIAVACAHTNWDVAPGGVNDALADLLGLSDTRPLQITYREPLISIAVFLPEEYREAVFDAMTAAGAGQMGKYDRCGFWTHGTGTFRPGDGAHPFIGARGRVETVAEARMEMVCPAHKQEAVVAALRNAHPYEEPAFYVIQLANSSGEHGIGRIGMLAAPLPARDFHQMVKAALGFPEVRMVSDSPDRSIRTVAVCGGAGAYLMSDAHRAGADAFVTADVRHHEYIDALTLGIALIDAGHAQTETPGARQLAERLRNLLESAGVAVTFA